MRQPSKFGKYLLLDRIAVGGMAEVFVAKAFGVEGFERLLAIKKILPTMGEDQEFISMFVDEARIAVQLQHSNIVQILELGKHDENLYIAMEYISGRDVRQLLDRFRKRGRPMPVPQACYIVAKVCEALDYAHRKRDSRGQPLGIVHRDVSPQNVLVSYEGDVKLIDFGIAKAESRLQKTQAGILKGKFSYMSPEMTRGQSIDHRSDIFATGVVLWELLTGEKLFTGDNDFAVLEKVKKGLVPPPRSLNPELPEAVEKVVLRALAAETVDRFQWASELHDELMRFCFIGGAVYTSRQLAEWMHEEFIAEYEKELGRMRQWAATDQDEVTPADPSRAPPPRRPAPTEKSAGGLALVSAQIAALDKPPPAVVKPPEGDLPTQQWAVPADADTLVQPPTPNNRSENTRPSRRPGAEVPRDAPKPGEVDAQELPTMKMDGAALAAAELEFVRKIGASQPRTERDQEESTAVGPPRPLVDPSLFATIPDGFEPPSAAEVTPAGEVRLKALLQGDDSEKRSAGQAARRALQERVVIGGPADAEPARADVGRPVAARQDDPKVDASAEVTPAHAIAAPPPRPVRPVEPRPRGNGIDKLRSAAREDPGASDDEPTVSDDATVTRQRPPRRQAPAAPQPTSRASSRRFVWLVAPALLAAALGLVWQLQTPPPKPPRTGTIVVSVKPQVQGELVVDGASSPLGASPFVGRGLAAGEHRIEVRAAGYKPFAQALTLAGGQQQSLEVSLVADAPMVVPDLVVKEPRRPQQPGRDGPRRDEPPVAARDGAEAAPGHVEQGGSPVRVDPSPRPRPPKPAVTVASSGLEQGESPRLHVTSEPPGAEVAVDDRAFGRAPIFATGLDSSHYHRVVATLPGYAPARTAARLQASGITELRVTLSPLPTSASEEPLTISEATAGPVGYLVAATKPVASVSIDGRETGRWTPVLPSNPIALAVGAHSVVFITAAGEKHEEQIVIEAGKTARLFPRF